MHRHTGLPVGCGNGVVLPTKQLDVKQGQHLHRIGFSQSLNFRTRPVEEHGLQGRPFQPRTPIAPQAAQLLTQGLRPWRPTLTAICRGKGRFLRVVAHNMSRPPSCTVE